MTVDLTNDFFIVQKDGDTFKVKGENLSSVEGYLIIQRAGSTYKLLVSNAAGVIEDDPSNPDWLIVQQSNATYKVKGSTVIEQLFNSTPNPATEGIVNVTFIPQDGNTLFAPRAHQTIVPTGSEIYVSDHWQQGTTDVNVLFNGTGYTAYQPITAQFPNQSNYVGDNGERGGVGTITFNPPVVSKAPIWVYMAAQEQGFFPMVNDVEFDIIKDSRWHFYNTGECVIHKISWRRSKVGYDCQSGFAFFSSDGTYKGRMGATQLDHDDNELTFEALGNLNDFVVGDNVYMSDRKGEKAGYRPKTAKIRTVSVQTTATPNFDFANSTLTFGSLESGSTSFFYLPAEEQTYTGLKFRPNYGGMLFGFTLQIWHKLEVCLFNQYGNGAGIPVGTLGLNVTGSNIATGIDCGPIQWAQRAGPTGPTFYTDITSKLPQLPYTLTTIGTYNGAAGDSTYWYGMKVDGKRLLQGEDLGTNQFILNLEDATDLVYFKKGDRVNEDSIVVDVSVDAATLVVSGPSTSKWKGASTGEEGGSEYVEAVDTISGVGIVDTIDLDEPTYQSPKILLRDANNQWVPSNGTSFYCSYETPPMAEGVCGPIIRYAESESETYVYVRGAVPDTFVQGARVYECDAQGNPMCQLWDQRYTWSTQGTNSNGFNVPNCFNGINDWSSNYMMPNAPNTTMTYTLPGGADIALSPGQERKEINVTVIWTAPPIQGFSVNGRSFDSRVQPTLGNYYDITNVEAEVGATGGKLNSVNCLWNASNYLGCIVYISYWDFNNGLMRQLVDAGIRNTRDLAAVNGTAFQITDPIGANMGPTPFTPGSYLKVMTAREVATMNTKLLVDKRMIRQAFDLIEASGASFSQ